jgi:threonine dehydrogenase-like Zn-dependent dehydrogenase
LKAVTCQHGTLSVCDLPEPVPGPGQLLVDVGRCGICGSDLHARTQMDGLADLLVEIGYDDLMRSDQQIVFGHEFVGVVAGRGPETRGHLRVGTPVVSVPLLRRGSAVHPTGLSVQAPGGYAERMLVQESLTLAVPNGLPPEVAVLTEPMAVGWHAVNRGEVRRRDVAIVIGCGPVGLAVVTLLKARGVRTVVASDPSAGRRALAARCGADVVVDPAVDSPYAAADATTRTGHLTTAPAVLGAAVDGIETMSRLPVPWWHTWRALEKVGVTIPKAPVVFECVGVPGMIDGVITGAPMFSRVVVVGVCMGGDTIRPSMAINKEIDLRFVIGYTPLEFRDTLHALAEGTVDVSPLVTGVTGLAGVAGAFTTLGNPEAQAKVLIDPSLTADTILAPA